jgi:transposase InsO family protein
MDVYESRKQAISQYHAGAKISQIVRTLNKSRQWFYFWLKRYETYNGTGEWYKGYSKAPRSKPLKISDDIEQQVITARASLQQRRYAQTGAIAIQYEMYRQGLSPPPVWTINRILSRHGLNNKPTSSYRKSDKDYPKLFIHTHQMDLVGPRYIKGDGRYFTLNIIDTTCHSCFVRPVRAKSTAEVVKALAAFWNSHGLPDALQMDNELAFRGSNRHPRSFGAVVRLALALQVAPVFIPIAEPWRNGMIEKFNHTMDKRFLKAVMFKSFDHLCQEAVKFVNFHNDNHRYSSQGQKTPIEMRAKLPQPYRYDNSFDLNKKIPMESGIVYFIRFIRGDAVLKLNTESFKVKDVLKYSYVVAEANIDRQNLIIRQDGEIVQTIPYSMPVDW